MVVYILIGLGVALLLGVYVVLIKGSRREEILLPGDLPLDPQVFTIFQPDPAEITFCQVGDAVTLYSTHRSYYQVSVYRQSIARGGPKIGTIVGKPGKTLLNLIKSGRPYQVTIADIKKGYLDICLQFS